MFTSKPLRPDLGFALLDTRRESRLRVKCYPRPMLWHEHRWEWISTAFIINLLWLAINQWPVLDILATCWNVPASHFPSFFMVGTGLQYKRYPDIYFSLPPPTQILIVCLFSFVVVVLVFVLWYKKGVKSMLSFRSTLHHYVYFILTTSSAIVQIH